MKKNVKHKIKNLEIHKDKRGWLVNLLKTDELEKPIKQLHVASIKKGAVRGNHYHSKRIEWFFIIAGRATLVLEDIKSKNREIFNLSSKSPRVITIYPFIAHAVKNVGKETAYLLSAQNDVFDPEKPDRIPYKIY